MTNRDLRAKYGGKSAEAVNRAIRAELPGGEEVLDASRKLHAELAKPHRDRTPAELAILATVKGLLLGATDAMGRAIKVRYGIGAEGTTGHAATARPTKPSTPHPPPAAASTKVVGDHIPAALVARLATEPLDAIARDTGITANRLRRERERLGIMPTAGFEPARPWTAALDDMIRSGKTDREVAEAAGDGRNAECVRRRRIKLLGDRGTRKARWTPEADRIVMTMGTAEAVAALAEIGVVTKPTNVNLRRSRLKGR